MKDSAYYRDLAARHLVGNYGEREIVVARGRGARVWDIEGREYLDFLAGISVNNLGHCPDVVTEAIRRQAEILVHCSNLYLIPQQAELAARLCEVSFAERCFFANSGAEVNEGAIKLARIHSRKTFGPGRHEIITMRNSFHGRTIATITATGQDKVQSGFEPLLDGFTYARFNDLDSVRRAVTEKTCAIMVEPVQGEGGVTAATGEFLHGLRALCDRLNLLLIYDEIQCGMGRTGHLFAHQAYGAEPDIMTLAKALGNGVPVGALLTREKIAAAFTPGSHGTTFGGNPFAMSVALAVLNHMVAEDIPGLAARTGAYFRERLAARIGDYPNVAEFRGLGLMVGIALSHPGAGVVKEAARRGLLMNCTMGNVLRLLPPLTVTREECDRAVEILAGVLSLEEIRASGPQPTPPVAEPAAVTSQGGRA